MIIQSLSYKTVKGKVKFPISQHSRHFINPVKCTHNIMFGALNSQYISCRAKRKQFIYICIHIYIYIYKYIYMYMYIHIYEYIYIKIFEYVLDI